MRTILFILAFMLIFMFTGCSASNIPELSEESIEEFDVTESIVTPTPSTTKPVTEEQPDQTDALSLEEKFKKINFSIVSGNYTRKVLQDEIEFNEMFSFEKSCFIRIASNELEQEVYAYNYVADDFTYLYYFDGELLAKSKINMTTGSVLIDTAGYAELLTADAEELKQYFSDLLNASDLTIEEL